jgi:general secretion pathway protein G
MRKQAFSLIELMIVVAIIGILVAALLPELKSMIENSKISRAKQDLKALKDGIIRYQADMSRKCTNLNYLVPKYVPKLKNDPWGTPYSIRPDFNIVFSYGPDRKAKYSYISVTSPVNLDNIVFSYAPELRMKDAFVSLDIDGNGRLNNGDRITIVFTKPISTFGSPVSGTDFNFYFSMGDSSPLSLNETEYVRDLDGGNDATFSRFDVVNPSTGYIDNSYIYTGNIKKGEDAIILEINATDDWQWESELYINLSNGGKNKFKDVLGQPIKINNYNTQIIFSK